MKRNNYSILYSGLLALAVLITACSDDNDDDISITEGIIMADIPADTGGVGGPPGQPVVLNYTYVDLETQTIVEDPNTTQWDLGFASTNVITNSGPNGPGNGGAIILSVPFAELDAPATTGYVQDTDTSFAIPPGGGNGWYNYNPGLNAILPITDQTILVRSGDGESYTKVEFLNYYQGNPDMTSEEFINIETRSESRFYTIRLFNF